MRREIRQVCIVVSGLWLAGCATGQQPYDSQAALSPEERRLQSVEDKLAVVNRRLNAIDDSSRNSRMADDLRDLRGQVEELQHEQQQNQQQLKATLANYDQRLQRLESGGALPPGSGAASLPSSPAAAASAAAADSGSVGAMSAPMAGNASAASASTAPATAGVANNPDEQAAYIRSFNLLQAGKMDDAISGFKAMLHQYPQGNFADNAWYWLGSAYYVKGDSSDALSSFKSLLSQFPNSPKVPDALLKTGIIYEDAHKNDQAKVAYKRVIDTYPTTNAATLARQRLAKLSG